MKRILTFCLLLSMFFTANAFAYDLLESIGMGTKSGDVKSSLFGSLEFLPIVTREAYADKHKRGVLGGGLEYNIITLETTTCFGGFCTQSEEDEVGWGAYLKYAYLLSFNEGQPKKAGPYAFAKLGYFNSKKAATSGGALAIESNNGVGGSAGLGYYLGGNAIRLEVSQALGPVKGTRVELYFPWIWSLLGGKH